MNNDNDNNSADLETRRRRAQFRAWHRGMREVDLILGRFADARMHTLDARELEQFEALLDVPDGDFLKWVTGELAVPETNDTPLFRAICSQSHSSTV